MEFSKWLSEVTNNEISNIGVEINRSLRQHRKPGQPTGLLFDNIFGSDLRVVVPIETKAERDFQHALQEQGYTPDLKSGMVTHTIQSQRGPQIRTERIGSVLTKLLKKSAESESHKEIWQHWLSWWEKSKVSVGKPQVGGVSVIISRSPIDILRMSDHSEWNSCHSPDRKYDGSTYKFRCAIQEAKTGGAIAYVVRNSELAKIPDLQAKEIFADDERDIPGIEPLERVRLRRFSSNDADLLMPDLRTYGTRHTGLAATVKDWAWHTQREILDPANPPDYNKFDIHGGSYMDTSSIGIWSKFFGIDSHHLRAKQSIDGDDERNNDKYEPDLIAQAEEMINAHQWFHYDVSINDGDEDIFSGVDASTGFSIEKNEFIKLPTWREDGAIMRNVEQEMNLLPTSNLSTNVDDHEVNFFIYFRNEVNNMQELSEFLRDVDRSDARYDDDLVDFRTLLVSMGYLPDKSAEITQHPFRHFRIDDQDEDMSWVESGFEWIGDLQGTDSQYFNIHNRPTIDTPHQAIGQMHEIDFRSPLLGIMFRNILPEVFKKEHSRFYVNNPPISPLFGEVAFPIKVFTRFSAQVEDFADNISDFESLKSVDEHWKAYIDKMCQCWQRFKNNIMPVAQQVSQGLPAVNPIIRPPVLARPADIRPQMTLPFNQTPD